MNQIGGLAILAAIFFIHYNGYGEGTFTNLLANTGATGILLPLALLSVAALIKGAQMPFSKWLLGAMVAPTRLVPCSTLQPWLRLRRLLFFDYHRHSEIHLWQL